MRIIWYPAVTLDGFIATTSGNADWISPEDDRQFAELIKSCGALIIGRRTYDQYRHHENPYPQAHTYVYTRDRSLMSDDPAVSYVTGSPLELMRRLHADGHTRAVLSGGGDTNGLFAAANLIDEARISIYPLMLGSGIPLFGQFPSQRRMTLRDSTPLPGGVLHNRYVFD